MKYTISIDVPNIEEGIAFYSKVFGFKAKSRPVPTYTILISGDAQIGILEKPEGSSPAPGTDDVRKYSRHWTPVHVDFYVTDFVTTLEKAIEAGASIEQKFESGEGHPSVAFCCDPFGNGFCIIEER